MVLFWTVLLEPVIVLLEIGEVVILCPLNEKIEVVIGVPLTPFCVALEENAG